MVGLLFHRATHPCLGWATLGTLALSVVFMGQTYVQPSADSTDLRPKALNRLTFGFLGGKNEYSYTTGGYSISGGCSQLTRYDVGPGFGSGGIWYERKWERKPNKFTGLGLGAHFSGYDQSVDQSGEESIFDLGLVGYVDWDRPGYQLRGGLHAGSFNNALGDVPGTSILPILSLRLGPRDKAYFDGGVGMIFPTASFRPISGWA